VPFFVLARGASDAPSSAPLLRIVSARLAHEELAAVDIRGRREKIRVGLSLCRRCRTIEPHYLTPRFAMLDQAGGAVQ
jgi:hypothetical protein